jgi:hypothetical protein
MRDSGYLLVLNDLLTVVADIKKLFLWRKNTKNGTKNPT